MYPGALNQQQGLDIAIQAFDRIKDRLPNSEFHIYGSGADKGMLERIVEECSLGKRVQINKSVPIETIAEKMADAGIAVIPKRANLFGNEAFSTKSMEFMALGVPVIRDES